MKIRTFTLLLAVISVLPFFFGNPLRAQSKNNDGPALMSVHLISVPLEKEQEMAHIMSEFNKLFSILGFQDVKYQLWKVSGTQSGTYTHLWNSMWPNQDAYDKVHQNDDYKNMVEKYRVYVGDIIAKEMYNRYVEIIDIKN